MLDNNVIMEKAKQIQDYCKTHENCGGCAFVYWDYDYHCKLMPLKSLNGPEDWELDKEDRIY